MALTQSTVNTTNISELDPEPNDVGGLTPSALQNLFDKYGIDFTAFFNDVHLAQLSSIVDGASGADNIGATPISTSGDTVQEVMEWLSAQINTLASAGVPDGYIADVKLSDLAGDIKERFSTHATSTSSETVKAHVELATAAETTSGTDNTRAVHPAGLKVELDKKIPNDGVTLISAAQIPLKIVSGSYAGDNSASRQITVGGQPKMLFWTTLGKSSSAARALTLYHSGTGGLIGDINNAGTSLLSETQTVGTIQINATGFSVVVDFNVTGDTYGWVAIY